MTTDNADRLEPLRIEATNAAPASRLHPAWLAFVRFCHELQFGEIEKLKIQDGLPVLAEVTTRKIKFGR